MAEVNSKQFEERIIDIKSSRGGKRGGRAV
jgi:hypothetical protein